MDEHRDIYTKPTGKPEGPDALPAPEPDPTELRAKTRRRTVWNVGLMVFLLAAAAVYFFLQNPKTNPLTDLLRGGTNRAPRDVTRPATLSALPAPPSESLSRSLDEIEKQAPADLPAPKVAEVMTAIRLANEYMIRRELDPAEEQARRALAIWPDMNAALRMLGAIYLQRGQFDQAILTLEKAMRGDPFNGSTLNNLATAYMQRGDLARSEDLFLSALQVRPDDAISHVNLGLLYILWGRYDQAVENLQVVAKLWPDNVNVRNNLGVSTLRLGRYEEARAHFQRTIELQPQQAAGYFNTAISFILERNYTEAMTWLRKGIALSSPVDAQRQLMGTDFDPLRGLPEFQALVRDLSSPRAATPGAEATAR